MTEKKVGEYIRETRDFTERELGSLELVRLQDYAYKAFQAFHENILTNNERGAVDDSVRFVEGRLHQEIDRAVRESAIAEKVRFTVSELTGGNPSVMLKVRLDTLGDLYARICAQRLSRAADLWIGERVAMANRTEICLHPGSFREAPFDEKTGEMLTESRVAYVFPVFKPIEIKGPLIASIGETVRIGRVALNLTDSYGLLIYPEREKDRVHLWIAPDYKYDSANPKAFDSLEAVASYIKEGEK